MSSLTTLVALATLASPGDAVLLQFSSESCAPCRAMQPAVSRLITDGYPVQRIDADRHAETARQFNVRALPTFVLLAGNREVGRVEGPTSYDRLAQLFQAARPADAGEARSNNLESGMAAREPTALQPTEFRGGSAEQAAMAASVRLKVEDATGFGFGTGTIIDTHDNEALVVTCGHLFRESQGKGRVAIDLIAPGATQPVEGQLIAYDLDRDIALVSMRPGIAVTPAAVAPPGFVVRQRDRAFTVGCDKGGDATVRQSEITAVNKYRGKPNFTAAGAPIDGRSGGGLFTAEGLLIGICNAADPRDDEGLYAGLASIHWQLDQIGQSEIYQRAANVAQAEVNGSANAVAAQEPLERLQPASVPNLAASMPGGAQTVMPAGFTSPQERPSPLPVGGGQPPGGLADDSELVVIVRSKSNPTLRSEIYVVDQASPELLTGIVHAARRGAQERTTAIAAGQSTAGLSPQRFARREHGALPAVVRAQSGE